MKKLLFFIFCSIAITSFAQTLTYVDSSYTIPAQAYAYKLDAAPTIDGNGKEWDALPWTQAYFNDRDRNNDAMQDPFVSKTDYTPKFKAGWVAGTNKIYFLVSLLDDKWYPKSKNQMTDNYNCDGFELRLDPLNVKKAGETGDGSVHYIILEYGKNTAIEMGGITSATNYKAVWQADTLSYPKKVTLELELTLQPSIALTDYYVMGFYPYFNDNDGDVGKATAAVLWPQLWSVKDNKRLGVDQAWEHTYMWGELVCVNQRVFQVNAGGNLQNAIDDANVGDIVKIGPGTYAGNFIVPNPGVAIIGADSATTILQPVDDKLPVLDIKAGVYGIHVEGCKFKGNVINSALASAAGIKAAAGVTAIINNVFVDFASRAIDCSDNEGGNMIAGNRLSNIGGEALVINNTPFTAVRYNLIEIGGYKIISKINKDARAATNDIAYNVLRNFVSGSIGISYGVATATKASGWTWLIHHNYMYATRSQRATGSYDLGDNCIENQENTTAGSVTYMYNNTWAFIKNAAVQMNGPGANKFYLKNNISAYNSRQREKNMTDYDIRNKPAAADSPTVRIDHSLTFTELALRAIVAEEPFKHAVYANLVVNPLFADTLKDDLTLKATSPAIDKGAVDPFGFKFAYAGSAPDIGAFEYGMPQITTAVRFADHSGTIKNYSLGQNYPNPYNPATNIRFTIGKSGLVTLKVYNTLGQQVAVLIDTFKAAGAYAVSFNASSLPSGLYFYTLTAGDFSQTKKMMLMK
jgi:hypothetical protein